MTDNPVAKLSEQPIAQDLAKHLGVEVMMMLNAVQTMLPKGASFQTMMQCVAVSSELRLNPMLKQIYFMPTKGGAIAPIVSVDGWISIAQRHPEFDGWQFEIERDGGTFVSMTGTMHHKSRKHPTVITEYFEECARGAGPVWKTHPARMLRNRTITQLVRVGLGLGHGAMEPNEFEAWQATAPDEPIALEAEATPRDGGYLPRSTRDRPAATAFKEIGGVAKYNALVADIEAAATLDDLHACFDAYARNDMPWFEFPAGFARLIQDAYHYRIKDLDTPEPELALIDQIEAQIAAADDLSLLGELYHDHTSNGIAWGDLPEDQREDVQAIYDERVSEFREAAA